MDNNIQSALILLLVGMLSVFLILLLVVVTGNLLIRFVNRFATEPARVATGSAKKSNLNNTNYKTLAAISAAVEVVTGGKGRIEKIEKL
ncbi:MAG: OadG family transporter subunit [Saprospiraceae bacterium]